MNVNFAPKPTQPTSRLTPTNFKHHDDDDDDDDDGDIPPGFGPGAARDEDDLPEFNFSGGGSVPSSQQNFAQNPSRGSSGTVPFQSLSQIPSRPVDQMRELIHKYGQPKTGVPSGNWQDDNNRGFGAAIQPWNDDDDDIPEWQPQAPQHQQQQQSAQGFHQPTLRPHLVNQQQQQQVAVGIKSSTVNGVIAIFTTSNECDTRDLVGSSSPREWSATE